MGGSFLQEAPPQELSGKENFKDEKIPFVPALFVLIGFGLLCFLWLGLSRFSGRKSS
jgi:hypothetical protein